MNNISYDVYKQNICFPGQRGPRILTGNYFVITQFTEILNKQRKGLVFHCSDDCGFFFLTPNRNRARYTVTELSLEQYLRFVFIFQVNKCISNTKNEAEKLMEDNCTGRRAFNSDANRFIWAKVCTADNLMEAFHLNDQRPAVYIGKCQKERINE